MIRIYDKFSILDHKESFENIYNIKNKDISDIIFHGMLQSLILDLQIISNFNSKNDIFIHKNYIQSVINNVNELQKKSKDIRKVKVSNLFYESLNRLLISKGYII